MKRFLIALGLVTISSTAFAEGPTEEQYVSLKKRLDALEMVVNKLSASKIDSEAAKERTPTDTPVRIVDWSSVTWYAGAQPFYLISYKLANDSPKTIKLIDASLGFQDAHGQELFRIPIDHSIVIAPGEVTLIARNHMVWYSAAHKDAGQERFSKLAKEDIVGKLVVRSVVYNDNTVVNYTP